MVLSDTHLYQQCILIYRVFLLVFDLALPLNRLFVIQCYRLICGLNILPALAGPETCHLSLRSYSIENS